MWNDPHQIYLYGVYAVFAFASIAFGLLMKISAPYGRHRRKGWGPEINDTLGWIIMESPCVLLFAFVYFRGADAIRLAPLILFALWQAHYVQRTYVYPFLLRGKNRKTPIVIVALAVCYNSINAPINAYALSHMSAYPDSWVRDPRFLIGGALFLVGYSINRHSDRVLRGLRKPGEKSRYVIPNEGFHRLVACPNYFGELLEWIGWTIAVWNLAGLSFVLFTAANLVPRALSNLKWYRETFDDYPNDRKAIIPFVL